VYFSNLLVVSGFIGATLAAIVIWPTGSNVVTMQSETASRTTLAIARVPVSSFISDTAERKIQRLRAVLFSVCQAIPREAFDFVHNHISSRRG